MAKGDTALAAVVICQIGLPPLEHNGYAKALSLAETELDRGTDPVALLKGLGMLPAGMRTWDWRKDCESGKSQERDAKGKYAPEGGQSMSETAAEHAA